MPTSLRAPTLFQGSLLCSVTEGLDEGVSVCPGLCPLSLSIVSAPPSSLKKLFLPWPSLGELRLPSYTAVILQGSLGLLATASLMSQEPSCPLPPEQSEGVMGKEESHRCPV